jgi:acetyl-CoA synthetase
MIQQCIFCGNSMAQIKTVTPNMLDYEALYATYAWEQTEKELHLPRKEGYNKAAICIDGHPSTVMARTALIWEALDGHVETFSFTELSKRSNQIAHFLRELGIQKGDRIFVFLERIPELYMTLLAGLKLGAIVGPLFAAFGPEAIRDRVQDCEAKLIITSPQLKSRIDEILPECHTVEKVVIVDREKLHKRAKTYEILFHEGVDHQSETFQIPYTDRDDYSIIHYTSGTTGKPKGAVHRHYAIVSQAATGKYVLDLHPESDIYWCTADPGWVTGTSYGIFAPWSLGCTQLVIQAGFKAPIWYQALQKHQVSVWYTAPTAIRMLMKAGDTLVKNYDLSHLRHALSVGEPLNPEAIAWGERVFGRTFYDTWWQTETGCMHICNYPCLPVRPGSMGKPHPGVEAAILNDHFEPVALGMKGHLAIKPTAPSFFRTYWNKEEMYFSRQKNGWYITGDQARCDSDGYYWFIGRSDDVINSAGHLIGPFEVESTLIEHPAVAEAAVIGKPDPERHEIVKAFVSLKTGYEASEQLQEEIKHFVRDRLAAHAYPREIEIVDNLPKTRSGKIMRRLLKARELGLPEGDISTLEDS